MGKEEEEEEWDADMEECNKDITGTGVIKQAVTKWWTEWGKQTGFVWRRRRRTTTTTTTTVATTVATTTTTQEGAEEKDEEEKEEWGLREGEGWRRGS